MFVVGLFMVPSAEFYFFSSDSLNCAASIVRVRYYTNQIVLNTLWNPYLKQATKNVSRYLYFPKFPIPKEIPSVIQLYCNKLYNTSIKHK